MKDKANKSPTGEEKRALPRFVPREASSERRKLLMLSNDEQGFQSAYGAVLNLSEAGACVIVDRYFDVGRQVRFGIAHHRDPGFFLTDAEIVWRRGGDGQDGVEPGMFLHGVKLAPLPDCARLELEHQRRLTKRVELRLLADRKEPRWYGVAAICLTVLLLFLVGGAPFAIGRWKSAMGERVRASAARVEQKIQWLDTAIRFDVERQHILLEIQGEILRANPNADRGEAYRYAELLLQATEKYPTIDPILFLSVGIIESRYDPSATSHANAKGLYQIWPSTGRLLAQLLDWSYSDEMLYDPEKNTELAALYLDILLSTYDGDIEMVLAEYNGGTRNARYLRAKSPLTSPETAAYVEKVGDVYGRLTAIFDSGRLVVAGE